MGKASRQKAERRELNRRETDRDNSQRSPQIGGPNYVARVEGTVFQGPLPHPDILAKYNDAVPNGAERILSMAEKNQEHRQALERAVIPAGVRSERIGQVLGFVLYMATLVSGTYLVAENKDTVGIVEMLASTATFAGLYLRAQVEKKRELRGKRP